MSITKLRYFKHTNRRTRNHRKSLAKRLRRSGLKIHVKR